MEVNQRWLNKACGGSDRGESSRGLPFALVGNGDAPPALHGLGHRRLSQLPLQALPAAARQVGRCRGGRGGVRYGGNRSPAFWEHPRRRGCPLGVTPLLERIPL